MHFNAAESLHLARLFAWLGAGERLASDCAWRQAELTEDRRHRRFFRAQSRQESFHSLVFGGAISWVSASGSRTVGASRPLAAYASRLEDALARGDLAESLLGQQVILEGLGEVILAALFRGAERRGSGFRRLRRTILNQEQAHHRFGERQLQAWIDGGRISPRALRVRAEPYLALIQEMLVTHEAVFDALREDPREYRKRLNDVMPGWLRPEPDDGQWF